MNDYTIDFNKLTSAEERIMLVLWEKGQCTSWDVVDYYHTDKPNQKTIASFLNILHKKGFVLRILISKKYYYYATISKEDYLMKIFLTMNHLYFNDNLDQFQQVFDKLMLKCINDKSLK